MQPTPKEKREWEDAEKSEVFGNRSKHSALETEAVFVSANRSDEIYYFKLRFIGNLSRHPSEYQNFDLSAFESRR